MEVLEICVKGSQRRLEITPVERLDRPRSTISTFSCDIVYWEYLAVNGYSLRGPPVCNSGC